MGTLEAPRKMVIDIFLPPTHCRRQVVIVANTLPADTEKLGEIVD
jgi:hypothetical protein